MLSIVTQTKELEQEAQPAYVPPSITPTAPPAYVAPTAPYISPAPMVAPPPPYQFRGEGGTPFGARPTIYVTPYSIRHDIEGLGFEVVPGDKGAVPTQPTLPGRPGENQVMPVPTGQQPTKPMVAPTQSPVQKPGPITGNVAGFDLARVPLWAWLVGAAFLGSRLLR